jgi:hypothetical protein
MAWKSVQLTQNGNTTTTWSFGPHSSISYHDAIVVGPEAGRSRVEIERIRVRTGPVNYLITVRVTGAGAMVYRLFAEQMN